MEEKRCNWFNDDNKKTKCNNPVGLWWCVECTYRNPLSPIYLCSECANVNKTLSKPLNTVLNTETNEKCHCFNASLVSNFANFKRKTSRK